jgi:hypothetical protein
MKLKVSFLQVFYLSLLLHSQLRRIIRELTLARQKMT